MEPCIPNYLPLKELKWDQLIHLIGKANYEIARYEGILQGIPNPEILLSPLMTQEAVISSKIEGTQATLEEVLKYEASPSLEPEKGEDIKEIINYRKALNIGSSQLETRPLSYNLIRLLHEILLTDVRGKNKALGEFRKIQNWIGKPNSTIEEARFVPPSPDKIMTYFTNLEEYIHFTEKDVLVQLAIIHGQFEIIHPFIDGNGRLGRMLIPLILFEKKILSKPCFYLSGYMERNRDVYYQRLNEITSTKNWEGWIDFFLSAIIEQSKINSKKAIEILMLYDEMKTKIPKLTRSQFSVQAIDCIFQKAIFSTNDFISISKIPKRSAIRILNELKSNDIIKVIIEGRGRKPCVMVFPKLIYLIQ